MNNNSPRTINRPFVILACFTLAAFLGACSSSTTTQPPATPTISTYFTQTNLVSDIPVTPAATTIDTLLQNPWGLAMGTGDRPWMSDNSSSTSTFYDTSGL